MTHTKANLFVRNIREKRVKVTANHKFNPFQIIRVWFYQYIVFVMENEQSESGERRNNILVHIYPYLYCMVFYKISVEILGNTHIYIHIYKFKQMLVCIYFWLNKIGNNKMYHQHCNYMIDFSS